MNIIEAICGDRVEDVIAQLVAAAPARVTFNGVTLRARYRTTKAADIVARYMGTWDKPYPKDTPESRREKKRRDAEIAAKQAVIDGLLAALVTLDFYDSSAVVHWVESIAEVADDVGVRLNRFAVAARFAAHGWGANVNTGADFNADDARNFAGWIVGQWLHCGYPMVTRFAADWRAKFIV